MTTACAAPSPSSRTAIRQASPTVHRYRVAIDAKLERATVELCPASPRDILPSRTLAPGQSRFRDRLLLARVSNGSTTLARNRKGFRPGRLAPGACLTYAVRLESRGRGSWHLEEGRVGAAILAPPDLWLWRAPDDTAPIEVRFALPPGIEASVPWPRNADGSYRVPPTTFRYVSHAAFGPLRSTELPVAGGVLRVSFLGAPFTGGDALLENALMEAARAAAAPLGRLPADTIQVLLLSVDGAKVRFGATARGGGAGIGLLVGRDVDTAALREDWVIVHELTHLLHPHLTFADTWFYEGLATYYGPLLRVRAGMIDADTAWAELDDGFRRGARSLRDQTLREDSAKMRQNNNYTRVYWSGAAILFRTDLALRTKSGGKRSLDDLIRALWTSCVRDPWSRPLEERLSRIDPKLAAPLRELMTENLDATSFPDLEEAYRLLGADRRTGSLSEAAPGHLPGPSIFAPATAVTSSGPPAKDVSRPASAGP